MSGSAMDSWHLSTPRLRLCRLNASDRPILIRMLSDYEVIKNLAVWPRDVDTDRIDQIIARHQTDDPGGYAILYGDELAGLIGAGPRIGYFLGRNYWGLGIMTEALAAVQKEALKTHEALSADAFIDNPASVKILEKCGWREIGTGESFSKARAQMVKDRQFVKCKRDDWRDTIQTERLTLRPAGLQDLEALHEIVSDKELAEILLWPWPASTAITRDRLTDAKARAGLISAVTLNGETIGRVSAGGGNIGFMFRRAFWGKGYATEAVKAKIVQAFQNPSVQKLEAGTWEHNHAAKRILEKLGFKQTGWGKMHSPAKEADLEGPEFTLTRSSWEAPNDTR